VCCGRSGKCAVEGLVSVLWKVWQVCCGRSGECAVEGLASVLWKVEMKDVAIFRTTAPQYSSSLNLSRVGDLHRLAEDSIRLRYFCDSL